MLRSLSPFAQTICTSARPWIMNGLGVAVVTTTVRLLLFAVTVAPTGMNNPSSGDLFLGSPTNSRFFFTTVAVIFVPSVHLIPLCRTNETLVGETTFQDCARFDVI